MKFLNAAFISVMLSTSLFANAGLILSDSTVVDKNAQSSSETFDVTGFENHTDLIFTVEARGDYGKYAPENIEFFIDNTSFGQYNWNTSGVTYALGASGDVQNDYILNFSFTISDIDWAVITDDFSVNVDWVNSSTVNANSSNGFYVNYSLSGNLAQPPAPAPVPEPTTLAVFALGMIGLASRRFKKQS
jgi:hypothetical protein